MNKTISVNLRGLCVAGIVFMAVSVTSLRASITTLDSAASSPADSGAAPAVATPDQSAPKLAATATNGASSSAVAVTAPSTAPVNEEVAAIKIVGEAEAGQEAHDSDASVLDVLNKNVDPDADKVGKPLVDPNKLATAVRPEDAALGRTTPITSLGVDLLNGLDPEGHATRLDPSVYDAVGR